MRVRFLQETDLGGSKVESGAQKDARHAVIDAQETSVYFDRSFPTHFTKGGKS